MLGPSPGSLPVSVWETWLVFCVGSGWFAFDIFKDFTAKSSRLPVLDEEF